MQDHLGELYARTSRFKLAATHWERALNEWNKSVPGDVDQQDVSRVDHRDAALRSANHLDPGLRRLGGELGNAVGLLLRPSPQVRARQESRMRWARSGERAAGSGDGVVPAAEVGAAAREVVPRRGTGVVEAGGERVAAVGAVPAAERGEVLARGQ